jgi:hypothetical protein
MKKMGTLRQPILFRRDHRLLLDSQTTLPAFAASCRTLPSAIAGNYRLFLRSFTMSWSRES